MSSILPQVSDCCTPCCPVLIVDLPSGGGGGSIGGGTFAYDNLPTFRQESRVAVLVDDTPAIVYGSVTRGDGGGGFYYFDAASLLAA